MSTFEFLHFHFVGQPFQKSNKGWKADVGKNIQHLRFNIFKATIIYHIQQCVNTKYSPFMFCESSLCSTAGVDVSQSSPVMKRTEHPLLVLCVVHVVHCSVWSKSIHVVKRLKSMLMENDRCYRVEFHLIVL